MVGVDDLQIVFGGALLGGHILQVGERLLRLVVVLVGQFYFFGGAAWESCRADGNEDREQEHCYGTAAVIRRKVKASHGYERNQGMSVLLKWTMPRSSANFSITAAASC